MPIKGTGFEVISEHLCHEGKLGYYRHLSPTTKCAMRFTVFLPPEAERDTAAKFPALFFLSGLTCTEENFTTKAGAYRMAAELGLAIIVPDTSPRGDDVPSDDSGELGKGAGFYLNATQEPWAKNYQMDSYITQELREMVLRNFPIDGDRLGIFGHSMGGHGALVLHLRNPGMFRSVSVFAPISSPIRSQWGEKAFRAYLGDDQSAWAKYDATELLKDYKVRPNEPTLLVDQGTADKFFDTSLKPYALAEACGEADFPLELRLQEGYDHGYFFIQTFIDDHLRHHAEYLR
ncbi:MAG: S-formylglutathione hydrolase [Alphaproteobacteria bacterium]|nr:S-formylglutathione hydrolase [Alphaproteobacteria bacterium]